MAQRIIELKIELESLKNEEFNFQFIKDFKSHTEEEFEIFKMENIVAFDRLKFIRNRIKDIEWELMTDEARMAHLQYLKGLKSKFEDEL